MPANAIVHMVQTAFLIDSYKKFSIAVLALVYVHNPLAPFEAFNQKTISFNPEAFAVK